MVRAHIHREATFRPAILMQSIVCSSLEYFCNPLEMINWYLIFIYQLPCMNPFPEVKSVLIVDNCKIHLSGCVEEICDQHGVWLVYVPPYWPELNLIEMCFSVFKSHLNCSNSLVNTQKTFTYLSHYRCFNG
ncbi:hypothetical protein VP01_4622g1 [Puccinia sorghi]|uniref:Tc1-like transposase DDE domain-containing protein n=1 Tax=Puccinia sorghi TaxID=27349 RepID=A0A0L6UQD9_9BASI|nr:hypothetical protein VP01_4622g1 [Puccinia sorghi]